MNVPQFFTDTTTESIGETKRSHEAAMPGLGAGPPLAAP
jgi:hypothetical protein